MHSFKQTVIPVVVHSLAALGLATLIGGAGCEAQSPSLTISERSEQELRDHFEVEVQPLLEQACGVCHGATGYSLQLRFLAPTATAPSVYDAVMAWPGLINSLDPALSRLVTKADHAGRAWAEAELDLILSWLNALDDFYQAGGGDDSA